MCFVLSILISGNTGLFCTFHIHLNNKNSVLYFLIFLVLTGFVYCSNQSKAVLPEYSQQNKLKHICKHNKQYTLSDCEWYHEITPSTIDYVL